MHSSVRDSNIYSQLGAVTKWSALSVVGQQVVLAISMKPPWFWLYEILPWEFFLNHSCGHHLNFEADWWGSGRTIVRRVISLFPSVSMVKERVSARILFLQMWIWIYLHAEIYPSQLRKSGSWWKWLIWGGTAQQSCFSCWGQPVPRSARVPSCSSRHCAHPSALGNGFYIAFTNRIKWQV